jgi:hypothetical protein
MRKGLSIRDFIAGAVFGLLLGTASFSVASIGYEGWTKLSSDFRIGYITGFLSLANLVRNLDPGGWLDTRYPAVPKATPIEWAATVDTLYKDPKFQRYSIHSMLQAAGSELQKTHGKPIDPYERVKQRAQTQMQRLEARRKAAGTKAGEKSASEPKHIQAPEKKVAAPAKAAKAGRKWCRCDGKDPKAERARRRAEAAEKAEAETQADAAKKADPGKQPDAAKKSDDSKPAEQANPAAK